MAKAPFNAQTATNNWVQGMAGATQAYTNGVNSVQTAPGQSAAAAVNSYQQGVLNAINDGSYVKGCQSVSLQTWQGLAISKGDPRLASGSTAAKGTMQQFLTNLGPAMQQAQAAANALPKGTFEQNMARQNAFATTLHQYKGKLSPK